MMSLAAVVALFAACARAAPPPPTAQCPSCHVVLILLSGLRADSVVPERMPRLAALKARSVSFDTAVTPSSWSLPAVATALTGAPEARHGLSNTTAFVPGGYGFVRLALSSATPTLASTLASAGYRTGFFYDHADIPLWASLDRGFSTATSAGAVKSAGGLGAAAVDWARASTGAPLFLTYLSDAAQNAFGAAQRDAKWWRDMRALSATETLFGISGEEAARARRLHDVGLAAQDAEAGGLLDGLAPVLPSSRTIVLVASSNGFALGEHDDFANGRSLHEECVRVPFFILVPGLLPRSLREQARLMDAAPTVLELVGVAGRGRSLAPLLRGGSAPPADALSETSMEGLTDQAALRTHDGWKLIVDRETGRRRLFDLNKDPGETRDLSQTRPESARELEGRLRRLRELEAAAP